MAHRDTHTPVARPRTGVIPDTITGPVSDGSSGRDPNPARDARGRRGAGDRHRDTARALSPQGPPRADFTATRS